MTLASQDHGRQGGPHGLEPGFGLGLELRVDPFEILVDLGHRGVAIAGVLGEHPAEDLL
jgi:hypothetical protein